MEERKRAARDSDSRPDPRRLLQAGYWGTADGRELLQGLQKAPTGLLEELRHEISVGDTTLAKVTVKVIMRGKQGAGKSSFVAACCGDAVLGDDYMKTVGLQVRTCLWPIKTVGERVFATNFELWDANADAMKTVGHFKAQCHDGKDVVVHVVSLRDKFFPMALMRDMANEDRSVVSGAPSPAHVIVVTKAEVASLAHRVTALQAVEEWARSNGIPCVAVCPTQAARAAATGSTVAGVPQDVGTALDTIAAAALARTLAAKAAASLSGAVGLAAAAAGGAGGKGKFALAAAKLRNATSRKAVLAAAAAAASAPSAT